MRRNKPQSVRQQHRRSGLAPLELVLALPLMLFVMALIINIGTVAAWKVREQGAARYASSRTKHLRSGDANPSPPRWPQSPRLRGGSGADLSDVAPLWHSLPDFPFHDMRVRPNGSIRVNDDFEKYFDIDHGVHDGRAPLVRQLPLLKNLLPKDGRYRFNIPQNVLDDTWEFHQMGYNHNRDRRARLLYEIEPSAWRNVSRLKDRLDYQKEQLTHPSNWPPPITPEHLKPLDNDGELGWLGRVTPMLPKVPPDFYAEVSGNVQGLCLADSAQLRRHPEYEAFLERIQSLPGRVGERFRSYYQERIDFLRSQNPLPPGALQEIQQLQQRIADINQFLTSLPRENR